MHLVCLNRNEKVIASVLQMHLACRLDWLLVCVYVYDLVSM